MRELTSSEIQAASGASVLGGGNGWLGLNWNETAGVIMALGALGGPGVALFGFAVGTSMLLATPDQSKNGGSG